MSSFEWESFLQQWSQDILAAMSVEQLAQLPKQVIESGWLGYPGATAEQISQTESRLGVTLPPSYRDFLQVTNGWRQTTPFIRRLWSTEGIERFAARHQTWIDAFTRQHENTQVSFDYAIELDEMWDPPTVADEEYFVYGDEQDCSKLRVEYLKTAIAISDVGQSAIYLLNPQVITEAGEWEAWFFGDWLPGADRYPSFQEMMVAEYHNFLELCDANVASESAPKPGSSTLPGLAISPELLPAIPIGAVHSEASKLAASTAVETLAAWRSLTRLTIEFQTRQLGAELEYQTVAVANSEPGITWHGLGGQALLQWLQAQLTPSNGLLQAAAPTATQLDLQAATPIATPSSVSPPPTLDVALEVEQIAIRQRSRFSAPVLMTFGGAKQARKIEHASLTSRQPFSLEVTLKLVGRDIAALANQTITYQARFHVQNQTTGQWIALGETLPEALVSDRPIYKAYLFDQTLEPGLYRLQLTVTLQGDVPRLVSFELPLLNLM